MPLSDEEKLKLLDSLLAKAKQEHTKLWQAKLADKQKLDTWKEGYMAALSWWLISFGQDD